MPWTYRHASREFRAFVEDVKERTGLQSDNMVYTAVDGVFRTFRRRLVVADAIAFANVLPSVLRAIFIQDWDPSEPPRPFTDRKSMTQEAQALRKNHNLTPDNAIEAVAWSLWRRVDHGEFERALARMPPEAREFWNVDAEPQEIAQRFA